MKLSQRNHRKLKPNRAQRQRVASGIAIQSWRDPFWNPLTSEQKKLIAQQARDERKEFIKHPDFKDRRGVGYRRELKGEQVRKDGFTITRKSFRPVDRKRNERTQRLGSTLNQHAKGGAK